MRVQSSFHSFFFHFLKDCWGKLEDRRLWCLPMDYFDAIKKFIAQHEVLNAIYNWQWPTILLTFLVCYTTYYLIVVVKKPQLVTCSEGWLRKSLEENLKTMHEHYWPTIWCFSAPIITICRVIFKRRPVVPYRRWGRPPLVWYCCALVVLKEDATSLPQLFVLLFAVTPQHA